MTQYWAFWEHPLPTLVLVVMLLGIHLNLLSHFETDMWPSHIETGWLFCRLEGHKKNQSHLWGLVLNSV